MTSQTPLPQSDPNSATPSPQPAITLDPIRNAGPAALDTHGFPGIAKAVLRELRIAWDNALRESMRLLRFDGHQLR